MPEHFLEERPTLTQTVDTFRIAGDMFVSGKELAFRNLNTPPYLPSVQDLGAHVAGENPDFRNLTEWERSFLLVNGIMGTFNLMARRADYQRKYYRFPEMVKHSLLNGIEKATDGELEFDPDKVDFKWSLFSVSLVAQEAEFQKAVEQQLGKERKVTGFVSRVATELGRLPIVLKNKDYKSTIWHEDIHVWQDEIMGLGTVDFDMSQAVTYPAVTRAAYDENIQPGDLEVNKGVLEEVLKLAKREMRVELAASLWSREMPYVEILESPDYRDLRFTYTNITNCIYSPATQLTEAAQIESHYDSLMRVSEVDLERRKLIAVAQEGIKRYKGPKNRWEIAAARATVMPHQYGTKLYQEVMLGRHGQLEKEPEINFTGPLASVLVTHARRMVDPEPYGQGGMIPKERVEQFYDVTERVFNDRSLYAPILERYNLGRDELPAVKQRLMHWASKSVPQGFRGKTQRELQQRLAV